MGTLANLEVKQFYICFAIFFTRGGDKMFDFKEVKTLKIKQEANHGTHFILTYLFLQITCNMRCIPN